MRVLRRSGSSSESPSGEGGAFEVLAQRDMDSLTRGWSTFAGFSGMRINGTKENPTGGAALFPTTEFPKLSVLRVTAGIEFRGAPDDLHDGAPRIGIYGIGSRGSWTDPYTMGTRGEDVHGYEWETGLYVGGKFTSGFRGMLAFRVLNAFGHHNDTQYILSVIPSAVSVPSPVDEKGAGK